MCRHALAQARHMPSGPCQWAEPEPTPMHGTSQKWYVPIGMSIPSTGRVQTGPCRSGTVYLSLLFSAKVGVIRQKLFGLLRDTPGVHFSFGTIKGQGIPKAARGMCSSKFCLHIAVDTPSTHRLFDAIASHCMPISDNIELPYEDILDYSKFCMFVWTSDAAKKDFLIDLIRGVTTQEWTKMW